MNWHRVVSTLRSAADADFKAAEENLSRSTTIFTYRMASFSILSALATALEAGASSHDAD